MVVARARALSVALLSTLTVALVACAGAGNEDLFEASADQSETAATLPAPATTPGTTPRPAPVTPGADAAPAPAPVEEKCTPEKEPNNDVNRATEFTSCISGKIESANDVDWATFDVPLDALEVTLKHSEKNGKVSYRVFLQGGLVAQSADEELRVLPGATYTVQMRLAPGNNGNRPTYELNVAFK